MRAIDNKSETFAASGAPPIRRRQRQGGHSMVEVALLAPWIFILFAAVFDLGFYSYAVIATQNAARSAAMYTSKSPFYAGDLTGACQIARREMQGLPNVPASLSSCVANAGAITDALPIAVSVDANWAPPDFAPAGSCTRVVVTYRSPQMFPLPGLMGRMTVTRIADARVRDN